MLTDPIHVSSQILHRSDLNQLISGSFTHKIDVCLSLSESLRLLERAQNKGSSFRLSQGISSDGTTDDLVRERILVAGNLLLLIRSMDHGFLNPAARSVA
jgi:hypothetical protein